MATIYQKSPIEQCLVLGVREAFIYPFTVSGGWTDLRVSYFVSMTTSTDLNAATTSSENIPSASDYRENGYWGLKSSGTQFPGTTGANFIGYSPITLGATETNYRPDLGEMFFRDDFGAGYSDVLLSNNTTRCPDSHLFSVHIHVPNTTQNDDQTLNCAYNIHRYQKTTDSNGKTGIYAYVNTEGDPDTISANWGVSSGYGVRELRNLSNRMSDDSFTLARSGYWTSSLSPTGDNLPSPNCIFIYLPFYNHRLRIHAILIEKMDDYPA